MSIKEGKLLYHLTELKNLDSIIKHGLLSRKLVTSLNLRFEDVADPKIIQNRDLLNLDKYIPFHFYPNTPFDYRAQNNHIDEDFIYLCLERDVAKINKFKVLPRHPLSGNDICNIYEYDEGMEKIDWVTMEARDYKYNNSKTICMAECLTEKIIPINAFQSIGVKNEKIQNLVKDKLKKKNIHIYVDIRKQWFYN